MQVIFGLAPYSEYQQFLYDTITDLREKGWNYRQIADWLNQNDYKTPRVTRTFHREEEKPTRCTIKQEIPTKTV